MSAIRQLLAFPVLLAVLVGPVRAANLSPDSVELNDGTRLSGLILQNTATTLVIQTRDGEATIPKEYIRRIDDAPDDGVIFDGVVGRDQLPSWRAIVHDLRTHDSVRSFEQIPPTGIDNGLLRNIPYLSFRINGTSELNVYGDPDDPVAVEFGIFGSRGVKKNQRRVLGEFIAGHLHSRDQIAAFYSLGPDNRDARAGKLAFRLIRPGDPDAYGGTWLVVYRPDRVERARLGDRAYAELTRPFADVNNKDGSLRAANQESNRNWLQNAVKWMTGEKPVLRGFYRDKNGVFRVLTHDS